MAKFQDIHGDIVDFNGANATGTSNLKEKITGQTGYNERIDNVQIMLPLNF